MYKFNKFLLKILKNSGNYFTLYIALIALIFSVFLALNGKDFLAIYLKIDAAILYYFHISKLNKKLEKEKRDLSKVRIKLYKSIAAKLSQINRIQIKTMDGIKAILKRIV